MNPLILNIKNYKYHNIVHYFRRNYDGIGAMASGLILMFISLMVSDDPMPDTLVLSAIILGKTLHNRHF